MGNGLPCCLLGRPKLPPLPDPKPVPKRKGLKSAKTALNLPQEIASSELLHPRKKPVVFTPHLILKLLRMDLMRKSFQISILASGKSRLGVLSSPSVTALIEDKRKLKLTEESLEETVPAPKYDLIKISNLSISKQQDLVWVLAEYKDEDNHEIEKLDGFLEVKKLTRFGVPRPRVLVFSTEALYVCDSKSLRSVKRHIPWDAVSCVKLAPDNKSVRIEIKNQANYCVFRTPQAPDIVNAIKTLHHLKFGSFPEVVLATSQQEMSSRNEQNPADFLEKERMGAYQILKLFGKANEQVVRCLTAGTLDTRGTRYNMKLLISTLAIYRTSVDYQLHSLVPLRKLSFFVIVNDQAQVLIQSTVGDYWVIHMEVLGLVDEVQKVHLADCGEALETQTMGIKEAWEIYHPKEKDVPKENDLGETQRQESQFLTLGASSTYLINP